MTVKVAFAVAPPPAAVTFPLPVAAPAGIVITFENPPLPFAVTVPNTVLCLTLSAKLTFTVAPAAKLEPVTVTVVPAGPFLGAKVIDAGGAAPPKGLYEGSAAPGISMLCVTLAQF